MVGRFQTLIKKEMAKLPPNMEYGKKIQKSYLYNLSYYTQTSPIIKIVCLLGLNAKWWLHSSQYLEK